jgi:hypothetical protein
MAGHSDESNGFLKSQITLHGAARRKVDEMKYYIIGILLVHLICSQTSEASSIKTNSNEYVFCYDVPANVIAIWEKSSFKEEQIRQCFLFQGIILPDEAKIDYKPAEGRLGVSVDASRAELVNALDSMDLLWQKANFTLMPKQLEIILEIVEFNKAEVDTLSKNGSLSVDALKKLWAQDKGALVYAPRIVTQSGQEATLKGVNEYIYPTNSAQFAAAGTGDVMSNSFWHVESESFESREVGVILQVLPEISPEGKVINLTLTPKAVLDPEWVDWNYIYTNKLGDVKTAIVSMPSFRTVDFSTSISIANGSTVLAGGGVQGRKSDKIVYCLLTAKIIDLSGKPVVAPKSVE